MANKGKSFELERAGTGKEALEILEGNRGQFKSDPLFDNTNAGRHERRRYDPRRVVLGIDGEPINLED